MNKQNLPVTNLRCLRDPHFLKHPWHAGHCSYVGSIDPRRAHELRMRNKRAGGMAFAMVERLEKSTWGPGIKINASQRNFIIREIKALVMSTFPPMPPTNLEERNTK